MRLVFCVLSLKVLYLLPHLLKICIFFEHRSERLHLQFFFSNCVLDFLHSYTPDSLRRQSSVRLKHSILQQKSLFLIKYSLSFVQTIRIEIADFKRLELRQVRFYYAFGYGSSNKIDKLKYFMAFSKNCGKTERPHQNGILMFVQFPNKMRYFFLRCVCARVRLCECVLAHFWLMQLLTDVHVTVKYTYMRLSCSHPTPK